ncbi:helix-turn-helix domain-containing protein [Streptomyces sp. NPDC048057]|uniref:ArsR/SmtB family transcription factor n=1 Tax=Streptomyces sp. NPDC048057 TaxID=3155628 RepID=UPI003409E987
MDKTGPGGSRALSDDGRGLAGIAALLADRTRAHFCLTLLDGRAWTAGELARHAGVARSTATEHLNALVGAGLLDQVRQGRHRYVRLAGPEVAELIEHLAGLAETTVTAAAPAPATLSAAGRNRALARARTCYDHLAGALGVAITDAMTEHGLLDWTHGLTLTPAGAAWLGELGIPNPALTPGARRPAVRACQDWTERRPHLAGAVGAAICHHAFAAHWVTRVGTTRAVQLTDTGRSTLARHLGLTDTS